MIGDLKKNVFVKMVIDAKTLKCFAVILHIDIKQLMEESSYQPGYWLII